jgi:hypothetical protein
LIKNLLGRDKPEDKSYDYLQELVKKHKNPTPPWQSERLKFLNCNRTIEPKEEHESVMMYVAELRKLMSTCKYSETEYNDQLRDRLLHGCGEPAMQKVIIEVGDAVTLDTALTAALAYEAREKSLEEMSGELKSASAPTHRVESCERSCWRCRGWHNPDNCKFRNTACYSCGKQGHLRSQCHEKASGSSGRPNRGPNEQGDSGRPYRGPNKEQGDRDSKQQGGGKPFYKKQWRSKKQHKQHQVRESDSCTGADTAEDSEEDYETAFGIYSISDIISDIDCPGESICNVKVDPYMVRVQIANKNVTMELDTGASRTTISEKVYKNLFSEIPLQNSNMVLRSYTREIIPLLGVISVPVVYGERSLQLSLIIVKGDCPALLGRDWLRHIRLDWKNIFADYRCSSQSVNKVCTSRSTNVEHPKELENLLGQFQRVFKPDNVGIKGLKASIQLKPGVKPSYQKARPVPYAITEAVEKEYGRLVKAGILHNVEHSEWGIPVVNVVKENGNIRVCGDYKKVNDLIEDDGYKLPNA